MVLDRRTADEVALVHHTPVLARNFYVVVWEQVLGNRLVRLHSHSRGRSVAVVAVHMDLDRIVHLGSRNPLFVLAFSVP